MENIEHKADYKYLGAKYRFTYFQDTGVFKIEEMVRNNALKRFFTGLDFKWALVYFGHATPLNECLKWAEQLKQSKEG